jgi:protein-S-isoprenylcysteine O-methyltransferase Ste14
MSEKIGKLLKTYDRKEGLVKDLADKYKKGELTSKEIKEESKKRGMIVDKLSTTAIGIFFSLMGIIGFFLCIIPTIYRYSKFELLSFSTHFVKIDIPVIVIIIFLAIAVLMTPLIVYSSRLRKKIGGCDSEDFTVILIKEGPYSIVRHPTHLSALAWVIAVVFLISPWVSFTLLSIIGILMIIWAFYLMEIQEERFDQVKFGEEYRQYMKKVPRWNIIKGLWNVRKKRDDG